MSIAPPENTARSLDPFGFFIGHASAIRGLGGQLRGPDPTYAFHTPYIEYRPGPVLFTLRFENLAATLGELVIHVNSFVPGSGAHALLVTMTRESMVDLADGEAMVTLRINALANVGYALFGYFPEGVEASATGMSILVDELGTEEDLAGPGEIALPTRFGVDDVQHEPWLVSQWPPSFARPVSQTLTAAQLDEEAYRASLRSLALDGRSPASDWKQAFIVRAIETYGFLAPGAQGLALGDTSSAIATHLAARGCAITPAQDEDVRGFDFLWTIDAPARHDSLAEARAFIERSLLCLRPGGLAVHMIDIWPGEIEPRWNGAIPRQRIEAIALTLISRGHNVSQLAFGGAGDHLAFPGGAVPFGLVVRRRRLGSP